MSVCTLKCLLFNQPLGHISKEQTDGNLKNMPVIISCIFLYLFDRCKPKEHAMNNQLCVSVFDRCEPVYCKYQFFNQPMHTTVAKEHGKNIYWDDKNVVLLGMHLITLS